MSKRPTIDVRALAELARIEISDAEAEQLEQEIPGILSFVDTIQKATVSVIDRNPPLRNVMREDSEPHESGAYTESLLGEAPATKDGLLVVKQVVSRRR